MPLRGNVRYRAKRVNSREYVRLAYRGNKVVEAKVKRYEHPLHGRINAVARHLIGRR